MIIPAMTKPTVTLVTQAISPGIMKLWFRTYFPIRVVPVMSKAIPAITVA